MAARVHSPLKDAAINANNITRESYGLSKRLKELHIDVALQPHERFLFQMITFIGSRATRVEKA
jgi:hypothetical protein